MNILIKLSSLVGLTIAPLIAEKPHVDAAIAEPVPVEIREVVAEDSTSAAVEVMDTTQMP